MKQISLKMLSAAALAVLMSACQTTTEQSSAQSIERPPAVPSNTQTQDWFCARLPVSSTAGRSSMELFVRDQVISLASVESASGALYRSQDGTTEFWNKGDEATLTLEGQALPTCYVQGKLPPNFEARGNEPFWSIRFAQGSLEYQTPSTQSVSRIQLEQPFRSQHVLTSNTADGSLALNITRRVCHDSMTGLPFPYEVEGTIGQQSVKGCGGDTQRMLQGVEWHVSEINGNSTGSVIATISFLPDGRVVGQTGCNRFFGEYRFSGEGLELGQLGMTRRACMTEVGRIEQLYMQQLERVIGIEIDSVGALILRGRDGSIRAFAL
ncbi:MULTISPECIES: META domain-containing protein [Gammaproteobacteria]|uniref:META domain-containing protein n=1 Tax=Gammaproteobacteria TaxID=1236 RepID=UPI000DD08142|nr:MULTISPECIES: META domain-containing protein [Gammaproteobacteria]RTE85791.1 META domain-containing protein [Aliidiomarina sp. B3213]TCZ90207.1 META domain-containing protein [Lysobacter sp. N42]